MVLSILCIALSEAPLVSSQDSFLRLVESSSKEGANVVGLMRPSDDTIVPSSKLRPEAVAFSTSRVDAMLVPEQAKGAAHAPWFGRHSSDGVSKLFTKQWPFDAGELTWSDNGVSAVLLMEVKQARVLANGTDAERFIQLHLGRTLLLPKVAPEKVRPYLNSAGGSLHAGTLFRGLDTQSVDLPGGRVGEKILGPLKWHNIIYVATDGTNLIARMNFYEVEREIARDVANPRTRFLTQ